MVLHTSTVLISDVLYKSIPKVALITAVQVSKSKTSQPVCSITMQCVQTAEGKLYSLKVKEIQLTTLVTRDFSTFHLR